MSKIKKVEDHVDMVFDNPDEFKRLKMLDEAGSVVDTIIDNLENSIDHVPDQISGEEHVKSVQDELSKDSLTVAEMLMVFERGVSPAMQKKMKSYAAKCKAHEDEGKRRECLRGVMKKVHSEWMVSEEGTKYQEFFKSMLKKHGYNSPADIPADKKKEFFNMIDKKWKAKEETD